MLSCSQSDPEGEPTLQETAVGNAKEPQEIVCMCVYKYVCVSQISSVVEEGVGGDRGLRDLHAGRCDSKQNTL